MRRITKTSTETNRFAEKQIAVRIRLTVSAKLKFEIVVLLMLCLTAFSNNIEAQENAADDDKPIVVDTLLMTIPLTVSDAKGHNVPGLKKNNFTVFQNGEEQDITLFLNEEAPMNVAVLLDTSYSTRDVLDEIQDAARDFIKILRPEDRALIVSFDNRTQILSDLTADRKILSRAINQTHVADTNGSDMPDAVVKVVNNYFAQLKGRKAIVVLTDGQVSGRGLTAQQMLETLQKSDVLLYPIIFTKNASRTSRFRSAAAAPPYGILKIITEETAGRFYEKEAAKLKEAFRSIAEDLKNQYLIGFYPQESATGKSLGHIRVAVDRQGFAVRAKKKLSF